MNETNAERESLGTHALAIVAVAIAAGSATYALAPGDATGLYRLLMTVGVLSLAGIVAKRRLQ